MHRIASVVVMGVTAYFLIATSQAPCSARAETVMLTSRGTCGPDTPVTVAVDTRCVVAVSDTASGLPASGNIGRTPGSLLAQNINLGSISLDGGESRTCSLRPNDAGTGWDVTCDSCNADDDGGCMCSGTVAP